VLPDLPIQRPVERGFQVDENRQRQLQLRRAGSTSR
jgi:hypothetical protein